MWGCFEYLLGISLYTEYFLRRVATWSKGLMVRDEGILPWFGVELATWELNLYIAMRCSKQRISGKG